MRLPYRLIIVRRGEMGTFQAILQGLGRWPAGTAVMWDRRQNERRQQTQVVRTERRNGQRRAQPDAMWYTHGFIVVETSKLPGDAIRLQPLSRGAVRTASTNPSTARGG